MGRMFLLAFTRAHVLAFGPHWSQLLIPKPALCVEDICRVFHRFTVFCRGCGPVLDPPDAFARVSLSIAHSSRTMSPVLSIFAAATNFDALASSIFLPSTRWALSR